MSGFYFQAFVLFWELPVQVRVLKKFCVNDILVIWVDLDPAQEWESLHVNIDVNI